MSHCCMAMIRTMILSYKMMERSKTMERSKMIQSYTTMELSRTSLSYSSMEPSMMIPIPNRTSMIRQIEHL